MDDAKQKNRVAALKQELAAFRRDRPAPVKIAGMKTPAYAVLSDKERAEAVRNAPEDNN